MLGQYGRTARCAGFLCAALLGGCGSDGPGAPPPATGLSAKAQAGKALFFDKTLSASGVQSCATCHVPARAFTADPATDHNLPVPLGGRNMDLPGFRNAPSLVYASLTPAFSDDGPDGRVLPRRPRLLPGRAGAAAVRHRVRDGQCGCGRGAGRGCRPPRRRWQLFTAAFGTDVLATPRRRWQTWARRSRPTRRRRRSSIPSPASTTTGCRARPPSAPPSSAASRCSTIPGKGNCNACHPSSAPAIQRPRAVHRLQLRQHRRAAQLEHPGQPAATR